MLPTEVRIETVVWARASRRRTMSPLRVDEYGCATVGVDAARKRATNVAATRIIADIPDSRTSSGPPAKYARLCRRTRLSGNALPRARRRGSAKRDSARDLSGRLRGGAPT